MPTRPLRVLVVFGTRPEAVKMALPIRRLRQSPADFQARVCVTAQHRGLLDQALEVFAITPDVDLDLMTSGQSPSNVIARALEALEAVMARERPHVVMVQGDTATTFAAALAAYLAKIPVAHIEAGLRTDDRYSPFPEEMNRRLTTRLATLHFAPTERAAAALRAEGENEDSLVITGNPGVDALLDVRDRLLAGVIQRPAQPFARDPAKSLILVTSHRRENFGAGLAGICRAIARLAQRDDVEIVFPVHRNPNVAGPVHEQLASLKRVHLIEPADYVSFVDLMLRCRLILSDSGGVQEEAPALGKPVLVMRENTERPEAVEAGSALLVGADPARIVAAAEKLLDDPEAYRKMAQPRFPFGDGQASERIAQALLARFG